MFFNNLYIFSVITSINIICPLFNEEIKLSLYFSVYKLCHYWSHIVDAVSLSQMLILNAW